MNKKNIHQVIVILLVTLFSIGFISCGKNDDDDIIGDSTSSKAKVSLSLSGSGTTYTATVTVSGVNASDVTVMGVRAEPQSTSGYMPGIYFEAGSRTTKGTCKVTLKSGTTYYVYAYANINGTRVESSKQTIRVR